MTFKEALDLEIGDKIYLYGDKDKPQEIVNVWGIHGWYKKLKSGRTLDVCHMSEHMEIAPKDIVCEEKLEGKIKLTVFMFGQLNIKELDCPLDQDDREIFMLENKIERNKYGQYHCYNKKLL